MTFDTTIKKVNGFYIVDLQEQLRKGNTKRALAVTY
jgi:hypothetical protein